MKKNRLISLISGVVAAVICLSGCSGIKKLEDIRVTSATVGSIVPEGLGSLNIDLRVGVENPGTQVSFSNINCDLKYFGKVLGKVAVDPFTLKARTEEIYDLDTHVTLGENFSILDFGRIFKRWAIDDFTVDVKARVKVKGGISRDLAFNDVPLKKLIETAKK